MWGRKEDQTNGADAFASASQASRLSEAPPRPTASAPARPDPGKSRIGESIKFKGEIHSDEDFLVDGSVDGSISVPKHSVMIGPASNVHATIEARSVLIRGKVEGKINASEKLEISETGQFRGDLITRRLEIHEGAVFIGSSAVHQAKPAPAPQRAPAAEQQAKPNSPAPPAAPAPRMPAPPNAPTEAATAREPPNKP